MWWTMAEQGIFDNVLAKGIVGAAISSHYLLGVLLMIAIAKHEPPEVSI